MASVNGKYLLNKLESKVFIVPVKEFRSFVAVLLLALWLPATSHCLLEDAGWIHHSDCCDSGDDADGPGHDAADGVCQIEKAAFHLPKFQRVFVKTLPDFLWYPLALNDLHRAETVPPDILSRAAPPPALRATWQFSFRTALPPRAPSFVS